MPVIYSNFSLPQFQLIVSENDEGLQHFKKPFDGEEILDLIEDLNDQRKIEILNSHLLIGQLIKHKESVQFKKDEFGKPHLLYGTDHMSISHSFSRSCAIVANDDVGIDIQKSVAKIKRIENKFLSQRELDFIDPINEMEMLHVMWGAKECMYKAYGKKKVTFKTELAIDPFVYTSTGDNIKGHVKKENYETSFTIHYKKLDDYYLVFAIRNTRDIL